MVDEVLENVHHVGADVVERDGGVTAAAQTPLLGVVDAAPVPELLKVAITRSLCSDTETPQVTHFGYLGFIFWCMPFL